jgi:hypothetical protein
LHAAAVVQAVRLGVVWVVVHARIVLGNQEALGRKGPVVGLSQACVDAVLCVLDGGVLCFWRSVTLVQLSSTVSCARAC